MRGTAERVDILLIYREGWVCGAGLPAVRPIRISASGATPPVQCRMLPSLKTSALRPRPDRQQIGFELQLLVWAKVDFGFKRLIAGQ